jgi:LysR family glycine cleavage system transcriptional activator
LAALKRSFSMLAMQYGNGTAAASAAWRRLPLDLLPTFEAAARHLSFTAAAAELFLTQSAVSRQVQQLEQALDVQLFERKHRGLVLTEPGRLLQRTVTDCLERLADTSARIRSAQAPRQLAITCTPGFASFWLIPRLARFTAGHRDIDVRISATLEVLDLKRSDIDVAIRFVPRGTGRGPMLFAEEVQPLCAPALLQDAERPLKTPADLRHHTLLTVDLPQGMPTMDWEPWLELMGVPAIEPASTLRFTRYAEAVAAAIAGQGIVIGRLPLMADMVQDGRLVAPFRGKAASRRAYFVEVADRANGNPHAAEFAQWLVQEASAAAAPAEPPRRRPRKASFPAVDQGNSRPRP